MRGCTWLKNPNGSLVVMDEDEFKNKYQPTNNVSFVDWLRTTVGLAHWKHRSEDATNDEIEDSTDAAIESLSTAELVSYISQYLEETNR